MTQMSRQIALQLAAFSNKNRLKHAVFCAKRGEEGWPGMLTRRSLGAVREGGEAEA
jgi:hypothetical protein